MRTGRFYCWNLAPRGRVSSTYLIMRRPASSSREGKLCSWPRKGACPGKPIPVFAQKTLLCFFRGAPLFRCGESEFPPRDKHRAPPPPPRNNVEAGSESARNKKERFFCKRKTAQVRSTLCLGGRGGRRVLVEEKELRGGGHSKARTSSKARERFCLQTPDPRTSS